jgi:hypothetical protein
VAVCPDDATAEPISTTASLGMVTNLEVGARMVTIYRNFGV